MHQSGKIPAACICYSKSHGNYQGFEYDAIAIAYENADIVNVLDILLLMEMPKVMSFIRMAVL